MTITNMNFTNMTTTKLESKRFYSTAAMLLTSLLVAYLFSHSFLISIAFALFIAIFLFIAQQRGESKRNSAIQGACPELIDILISGVQFGLLLNESLSFLLASPSSV